MYKRIDISVKVTVDNANDIVRLLDKYNERVCEIAKGILMSDRYFSDLYPTYIANDGNEWRLYADFPFGKIKTSLQMLEFVLIVENQGGYTGSVKINKSNMNKFITVTRNDIASIQWTREPYERAATAKECRSEKKVSISINNIKYFYDNTTLLYEQIYGLKEIYVLETREEIESLIKQSG